MRSHAPGSFEAPDLGAAAEEAVAKSRAEAEGLLLDVEITAADLRASSDSLSAWDVADGPLAEFRVVAEQLAEGAVGDFDQQLSGLETFNIVLFGRTGAGKSSLIAAMARLDGSGVSRGESDWTEDASCVHWRGVRLYDTPGINGWGRLTARDALEARARDEVKKADVVVLCFDSQSQQATEFQKVAEWVLDYDKPVIAVLNTRNSRWGMPSVPAAARSGMAQQVRGHVENIQDGLTRVGLAGAPVVVISARRALDARAADPYLGPDAVGRGARVTRHSRDDLLTRSNLPTLELLIAEMVQHGAVDLRLASLRESARSSHRNIDVELALVQRQAAEAGSLAETTLDAALQVLGYPDATRRSQHLADTRVSHDLLTELERLRGEPFSGQVQGSLDRHVESLLGAHLKGLETESVRNAEEAVKQAFDDHRELSSADFEKAVYDETRIHAAAQAVWDAARAYADSKVRLAAGDAAADARFMARAHASQGRAGRGWRHAHNAARVGGLAAGVAMIFLGVTPLGFAAAVGAFLFGWGARRARKKAEKKRLEARSSSMARARLDVRSSYDQLREGLTAEMSDRIWRGSAAALNSTLEVAISLRLLDIELERLRAEVRDRADSIPQPPDVPGVIRHALDAVLAGRGPAGAAGILWGFNWVKEGWGSAAGQQPEVNDGAWTAFEEDLAPVMAGLLPNVDLPVVASWIGSLRSKREHAELRAIGESITIPDVPGVALIGDYNTGKTSLIKRLLAGAGRPIPPDLIVGSRPTTHEARTFDLDGVRLIDTPGFQSGDLQDEAEALRAIEEAAVILLLFQPNLVVGDRDLLRVLAEGGDATWPRASLCLAVVNRMDELGIDPDDSPAEFIRLCGRKREELVQALSRNGLPVEGDRVVFVAADPHGQVGDRSGATAADFAGFEHWDGIRALTRGLGEIAGPRSDHARATSTVLTGLGRLRQHVVILVARSQEAAKQEAELAQVDRALERAMGQATVLRRDIAHRAEGTVRTHAQQIYDELLGAATEQEIALQLEAFQNWWESPLLEAELQMWATDAQRRIGAWTDETASTLLRQFQRRSFQETFSDIPTVNLDALVKGRTGIDGMRLAHRGLAELVRHFSKRDAIYKAGKLINYKFRPWQATKVAGKVGKLGPALAALGVALEGLDWYQSNQQEKTRERARRSADTFFNDSVNAVVSALVSSQSESSPIHHLDEQIQVLAEARTGIEAQRQDLDGTRLAAQAEIAITKDLMTAGQALLAADNDQEKAA